MAPAPRPLSAPMEGSAYLPSLGLRSCSEGTVGSCPEYGPHTQVRPPGWKGDHSLVWSFSILSPPAPSPCSLPLEDPHPASASPLAGHWPLRRSPAPRGAPGG